ncbi:hypothetical protein GCM10010174_21490 [Kutzneria viridogrisea]
MDSGTAVSEGRAGAVGGRPAPRSTAEDAVVIPTGCPRFNFRDHFRHLVYMSGKGEFARDFPKGDYRRVRFCYPATRQTSGARAVARLVEAR